MSFLDNILKKKGFSLTKQKVVSNIYWAVLGKCVNLLGSLIVGIIVARYLGPGQYGLMNYVISYVAIFQVFADFGLDSIQIREESKNLNDRDKLIGTTFVLKLVFAAVAILLIFLFSAVSVDDNQTLVLIMLYSVTVFFNTTWVIRNHFTAMVWNEYIVKTEISRTVIGIAIKFVLLYLQAPLPWFIAALVFDSVLLASGYSLSYRKKIDSMTRWTFDKRLACYLLSQSFPLLLSGAALVIYHRIDQVMIGDMLDNESVGMYSVATRFVEVMIFVPTIIAQTVTPLLVKMRKENGEKYDKMASLFMNVTVWLCTIMAVAVSLVAYPLVYYTFGSQYLAAVSVLVIMAYKVIGDALSQTSGQLIIVEGKQKYVSLRNIIGCVVCVVLNWLFIPRYGIYGAAIVSIITVLSSGLIANSIIPAYRQIFRRQMAALLVGWKDITNIKSLLR